MGFIERMKEEARAKMLKLVLPEGRDSRVITAAKTLIDENLISEVFLVGDDNEIRKNADSIGVKLNDRIIIVNPEKSPNRDEYVNEYYELRKHKGMTEAQAAEEMKGVLSWGAMMVRKDVAYAMVAGAENSTGAVISAALKIIKTAPGIKTASSCFIMDKPGSKWGHNGSLIMADCAVIIDPTSEQLADIVLAAADSCRSYLLTEPKIAMMSFSTKGSATHETVDRVTKALEIVKAASPDLDVDGELQLDASIIPEVGQRKAPGSKVAGYANTLIFPNLNAGNIGYKLTQRFGGFEAYGPVLQGFAKPVSDLSRGCNANDIVYSSLATINKK
ncbi:MAG: phosphate acetyltransferase [Spirochaetales bacterium]|nr:phosphate acetyltransferase [Spirochaetales bacterium]